MMSRRYETEVTISINGDEQDVTVRAQVSYEIGFAGGWGGVVDGAIEAFVGGAWVDLDDLALDDGDRERVDEALSSACSEDDSDARSCA